MVIMTNTTPIPDNEKYQHEPQVMQMHRDPEQAEQSKRTSKCFSKHVQSVNDMLTYTQNADHFWFFY